MAGISSRFSSPNEDRKLALCNWGDALRRQEDYKQAAEKYGDGIKVDSEYVDAYVKLGDVREPSALVRNPFK